VLFTVPLLETFPETVVLLAKLIIPVELLVTFPPIVTDKVTPTVPAPLLTKLPVIPEAPVGVDKVTAPELTVTLPFIAAGPLTVSV